MTQEIEWADPLFKRAYESRHIATDPLHIKQEMRYAVVRLRDNETLSEHVWSGDAAKGVHRLNVAAGGCPRCGGDGSIIGDWNYDNAIGEMCPDCEGTGCVTGPSCLDELVADQ